MDKKERMNIILINEGYFYGLEKLRSEIPADKLVPMVQHVYKFINAKVQEAKKELVHIQTALNHMEAECVRGGQRSFVGNNIPAEASSLMSACMRLDGWTLSLLESTYSLDNAVLTPETGANLINQTGNFRKLWAERGKRGGEYNTMKNHPEFFDAGKIIFEDGGKAQW
jgi:hypothetical protein